MQENGRVALFVPSLRGGGAERVVMSLANGFAAQGIKTDLVLAQAAGPYLGNVSHNVRIIDLGAARVLLSLPGLTHYLRRHRPQAMLSAMSHANVVAVWARQCSKVEMRLVVSERNTPSNSLKGPPLARARYLPFLMRGTYPKADSVVAISHGVADDLANVTGLARDRITVIYNPAFFENLTAKAQERFTHPWFALGAPPVIIAAGRLTAQKDFPTLIRAFALVRKNRHYRMVILGDGKERQALEDMIQHLGLATDVLMPGFQANPLVWMRHASLFVLSSAWEGFGNVLVEAMACGTPVVSTDCPSGPAEILEGGRWGRLVPVGDPVALAVAIEATLTDTQHPDVATRAEDFNVDRAVESYLRLLRGSDDRT